MKLCHSPYIYKKNDISRKEIFIPDRFISARKDMSEKVNLFQTGPIKQSSSVAKNHLLLKATTTTIPKEDPNELYKKSLASVLFNYHHPGDQLLRSQSSFVSPDMIYKFPMQPAIFHPENDFNHNFYHHCSDFSSTYIVTSMENGILYYFLNGKSLFVHLKSLDHQFKPLCAAHNPERVLFSEDHYLYSFDLNSKQLLCFSSTLIASPYVNPDYDQCKIVHIVKQIRNENCYCVGSFGGIVSSIDARTTDSGVNGSGFSFIIHDEIPCVTKPNPHDEYSYAIGYNDNKMRIWDSRRPDMPVFIGDSHKAAIRALDWHPNKRDQIISGGGMNDARIILWNITNQNIISELNTKELQITNIKISSCCQYLFFTTCKRNQSKTIVKKFPAFMNESSNSSVVGVLENVNGKKILDSFLFEEQNKYISLSSNGYIFEHNLTPKINLSKKHFPFDSLPFRQQLLTIR
jgi:WD40 repeat protein